VIYKYGNCDLPGIPSLWRGPVAIIHKHSGCVCSRKALRPVWMAEYLRDSWRLQRKTGVSWQSLRIAIFVVFGCQFCRDCNPCNLTDLIFTSGGKTSRDCIRATATSHSSSAFKFSVACNTCHFKPSLYKVSAKRH